MAQLKHKLEVMNKALSTLESSIETYDKYKKKYEQNDTSENEKIFLGMRDSVIQRFEYCVDLLWKLLKLYLEEVEKLELTTFSPRSIIRDISKTKFITESESVACMEMITNRNHTSHIYNEQVAEEIVARVPKFYELMRTLVDRVAGK